MSVATMNSSDRPMAASSAMDTESDDGEPRLEIVDEPMAVDVKTEVSVNVKPTPAPLLPPTIPGNFLAFRKSVSYDGSAVKAASERMRSIAEETNANEAIESLLMLGREPVVSPQSREVNGALGLSSYYAWKNEMHN